METRSVGGGGGWGVWGAGSAPLRAPLGTRCAVADATGVPAQRRRAARSRGRRPGPPSRPHHAPSAARGEANLPAWAPPSPCRTLTGRAPAHGGQTHVGDELGGVRGGHSGVRWGGGGCDDGGGRARTWNAVDLGSGSTRRELRPPKTHTSHRRWAAATHAPTPTPTRAPPAAPRTPAPSPSAPFSRATRPHWSTPRPHRSRVRRRRTCFSCARRRNSTQPPPAGRRGAAPAWRTSSHPRTRWWCRTPTAAWRCWRRHRVTEAEEEAEAD